MSNTWQVTWRCDGCGELAPGEFGAGSCASHKPRDWFARKDSDGVQVACSRRCIDTIATKSGKTSVVLPI